MFVDVCFPEGVFDVCLILRAFLRSEKKAQERLAVFLKVDSCLILQSLQ